MTIRVRSGQLAISGFHAKPVNTQLRSHSVSVHSAAKARMKESVAPAKAGAVGVMPPAAPAFAGATIFWVSQQPQAAAAGWTPERGAAGRPEHPTTYTGIAPC